MILSFGDKETEHIYHGISSKKARSRLNFILWEKAQIKLDMLDKACRLDDLKIPPNNRLEKLERNLVGYHSIRINDQYRVIFKWDSDGRGVREVKITDYH